MSDPISTLSDEPVMINAYGTPVPARLVADRIKLEDQAVRDLIARARDTQEALTAFKKRSMEDVQALLDLLAAHHGVQRSGRRGGVQLNTYDALMRVEVTIADGHTFGPELSLAKEKIDACITRWSDGARAELRQLVEDAFKVGKTGQVRVDRILGLRRIQSEDVEWLEAMALIDNALRVAASKAYVRFYARANLDADFEQIVLDASRL